MRFGKFIHVATVYQVTHIVLEDDSKIMVNWITDLEGHMNGAHLLFHYIWRMACTLNSFKATHSFKESDNGLGC